MECNIQSEQPMTDEAAHAATGKTLEAWFAELDAQGGSSLGRSKLNKYLYNERKVDAWWTTTIVVEYEKHKDIRKKDGLFEGYTICATKTIAAPVPAVYAAWSSADKLSDWFSDKVEADVKDGGSFRDAEGDTGTYLRVRPEKDLRFTWEHADFSSASQVDVQFQDKGKGKTGVIITHSRIQQRPEADGLRAAWLAALDKLKELLEN